MITTKELKIEKIVNPTSNYIEEELSRQKLNVLSWAITNYDEKFLYINVSIIG